MRREWTFLVISPNIPNVLHLEVHEKRTFQLEALAYQRLCNMHSTLEGGTCSWVREEKLTSNYPRNRILAKTIVNLGIKLGLNLEKKKKAGLTPCLYEQNRSITIQFSSFIRPSRNKNENFTWDFPWAKHATSQRKTSVLTMIPRNSKTFSVVSICSFAINFHASFSSS